MFANTQHKLWAAAITLLLLLSSCSGVEIQTSDGQALAAGSYKSYAFQTVPLEEEGRWSDPIYRLDPVIRAAIKEGLESKGYVEVPENAGLMVSYVYAPDYLSGVEPENASNISPVPSRNEIRPTNQASVDNAIALGGVKQSTNVNITLLDADNTDTLWTAKISMIVEDVNHMDSEAAQRKLSNSVKKALEELPAVGQ